MVGEGAVSRPALAYDVGAAPRPALANIEAEMALLGALMINNGLIDPIADTLAADDFSEPFVGEVYGLILKEHSLGRAVNPVTLHPHLAGNPDFTELGGPAWLAGLTGSPVAMIGARDFAVQIADLAARRRMVDGLDAAIVQASDLDQSLEAVIDLADGAISGARDARQDDYERTGAQCIDMVIGTFDEPVRGVECGVIPSIDRLLGPMRPGHLVIGAGRPGMGKTAAALSYALGAAGRGHGVLFFSLEMTADQLGERMAADLCFEAARVPYEAIRDRTLTRAQQTEVCRARGRLDDLPIAVIDKGGLPIGRIRSMVRRWRRRFAAQGRKLDLVVVDYLQLVRPDGRPNSREEAVAEISRTLKDIAKDNDLAVFALCQLSRKVEERADKRPMLSDLRESGSIEQDADAVMFFLRLEYYLRKEAEPDLADPKRPEWEQRLRACEGRIEFIVAKRRNGREGSRIGDFLGQFQAVRG